MNDPKRKSGGRPLKDASHTINQQGSFLSSTCRGYTRSNALCACLFVSMLNWWRVVSIVDKRLSVFYTVAWNYHFSTIIPPSFYEIYIYNLYLFDHYTLPISYPNINSCFIKNLFKKYLENLIARSSESIKWLIESDDSGWFLSRHQSLKTTGQNEQKGKKGQWKDN